MKIYTKIILDKNDNLISEEFYEYNGPLAVAGIRYSYKNTTTWWDEIAIRTEVQ